MRHSQAASPGPVAPQDDLAGALRRAKRPHVHVVGAAMGVIGAVGSEADIRSAIEQLHPRVLDDHGGGFSLHVFADAIRSRPERVAAAVDVRQAWTRAKDRYPSPPGFIGYPMGYEALHLAAISMGGTDPDTMAYIGKPTFDAYPKMWFATTHDRTLAFQHLHTIAGFCLSQDEFASLMRPALQERPTEAQSVLAGLMAEEGSVITWAASLLAETATRPSDIRTG